ncbi:hypothetical protein [Tateyamaria sp.]|uniref:hypothetical protein n=1 Tax=Tateyamaria sp. TaxID=1929288 RepID=UPI003277C176
MALRSLWGKGHFKEAHCSIQIEWLTRVAGRENEPLDQVLDRWLSPLDALYAAAGPVHIEIPHKTAWQTLFMAQAPGFHIAQAYVVAALKSPVALFCISKRHKRGGSPFIAQHLADRTQHVGFAAYFLIFILCVSKGLFGKAYGVTKREWLVQKKVSNHAICAARNVIKLTHRNPADQKRVLHQGHSSSRI